MSLGPIFPIFLFCFATSIAFAQEPTDDPDGGLVFQDVFQQVGLGRGAPSRSLKFGGPCVADVDSDGHYDIALNFHNRNRTRLYLGKGDGTFNIFINPATNRPFSTRVLDIHGIAVAQVTAKSRDRLISFSVGGGRGTMRRAAEIYLMSPDRSFTEVTNERGFGQLRSRPRNTVFMDLQLKNNRHRRRDGGGPDALFANFLLPPDGTNQFAYRNINGEYTPVEDVGDFDKQRRGRVEVTDINGDGIMEVISIQDLKFYKLNGPFNLTEVTTDVLPSGMNIPPLTVNSVVELDFDNDGDFDLYIARPIRGMTATRVSHDLLLRNDGGVYTDVSARANIPRGTNSMGVTVGDFNNDGFIDILVVLRKEEDMILLNQGDGTFVRVDGLIPKVPEDIGNNALAVDLELDGRVDAIVGHGGVKNPDFGPFLLMKNMMALTDDNRFLHVTVYNDPSRAATSLHAVVTVFLPRRRRMVRRVGGRGGQDGMGSYLDTVHFGLGGLSTVNLVRVKWTSNVVRRERGVAADSRLFFGVQ